MPPSPSAPDPAWERLLVGESAAIRQIVHLIGIVGPRRATVPITGQTGAGNEVAARAPRPPPRHRRTQLRPPPPHRRRPLPRRPLLPPQRRPHRDAPAPPAPCRYPASRRLFSRQILPCRVPPAQAPRPRCPRPPLRLFLARQRAPTGKRHRDGHCPRRRPPHPRRRRLPPLRRHRGPPPLRSLLRYRRPRR